MKKQMNYIVWFSLKKTSNKRGQIFIQQNFKTNFKVILVTTMIVCRRMGSASKGTEYKFRNKHSSWYFYKRVTYTHIDEWWLKMDVNLCFKVMVINLDCQLDLTEEKRTILNVGGCMP